MGIKPVRSCTGSIPSLRKNECTAVISGEVPWELACIAQLLRRFHGISCSKAVLCSQGKAQHTRGRGCAQHLAALRLCSAVADAPPCTAPAPGNALWSTQGSAAGEMLQLHGCTAPLCCGIRACQHSALMMTVL